VNVGFDESTRHGARALRWVFERIVPLSPRVQRVYVYHWNVTGLPTRWDSALIGPHGAARPAFRVVQREIVREDARRAVRGG
jgi:polysaccharide biosynthesis protein PslG